MRKSSLIGMAALAILLPTYASAQQIYSVSAHQLIETTNSESDVSQSMVIISSSVSKEKVTPSAGEKNVRVMHFVLQTENEDDPLQPTAFSFNTGNTYSLIKHAKLYYTGNSNKYAVTNLVAETDVTSDEFTFTTTSALALGAGENHFFVVIDVDDNAHNNDVLDINITKVTFTDESSFTDFTNPESTIKILNKIISQSDEHTYIISDTWLFTCSYADPDVPDFGFDIWNPGDQISIFVPATEGKKIQMFFSEFEALIYDSNSDSDPVTFVIYDGKGTTGKKLFEVTNKQNATALPPTITSSSADGAITVLFNPNNDDYIYMQGGKGWIAAVSETGGTITSTPAIVADSEAVKYITPDGRLIINRQGVLYNATGQRIK